MMEKSNFPSFDNRDSSNLSNFNKQKIGADAEQTAAGLELEHLISTSLENQHASKQSKVNKIKRDYVDDAHEISILFDQILSVQDTEDLLASVDKVNGLFIDDQQSGKKHINLVKQAHLVEILKLSGIVVPFPRPIASAQILSFLEDKAPGVFEKWEKLQNSYQQESIHTDFLKRDDVKHLIQQISLEIEEIFTGDYCIELFDQLEITKWLKELKQRDCYLMVRSSGAEDSEESANAGGNISKAYVQPNSDAVAKALGAVVASYFSINSLQNRINAGQNPFTQALQLSVTLQELIGETLSGSNEKDMIPISIVMFTNEPLYTNNESFRVVRISAAYGHGEGVVGNEGIATDTVLILQSEVDPSKLYVIYDNRDKPYRLAPVQTENGVVLQKIPNTDEMRNSRALSNKQLSQLYQWAMIGERFFDKQPTDMEIVLKGDTLYPVQARSIIRKLLKPNYLNLDKIEKESISPVKSSMRAEELAVAGKASLIELRDKNSIVVAETLKEAESLYQANVTQAVVILKPEPANSHSVVNFSSLGIVCLRLQNVQDYDEVKRLKDSHYKLVVCSQTGTIYEWDPQYDLKEFIADGFTSHPAKIALSLSSLGYLSNESQNPLSPKFKELLLAIESACTNEIALKKLKELKTEVLNETRKLQELEPLIIEYKLQQGKQALQVLSIYRGAIKIAAKEAKYALINRNEGERLRYLFHVKVIRSLIFKEQSTSRSIGQLSLSDMASIANEVKMLIDYQSHLTHKAHFLHLVPFASQGLTQEAADAWIDFLLQIDALKEQGDLSKETAVSFENLIERLKLANAFVPWQTFVFAKARSLNSIEAKLQIINESFPVEDCCYVDEQLKIQQGLQEIGNQILLFSDLRTFDKAFERLQFFENAEIWEKIAYELRNASPVACMIAQASLKLFVDVYDRAIKVMKMSVMIDNEDKVCLLKKMLIRYLTVLETWYLKIFEKIDFIYSVDKSVSQYLSKIKELLQIKISTDCHELYPSKNFSVLGSVFLSGTYFERHVPVTLEDIFTLIHQNFLAIIGLENKKLYTPFLDTSTLPSMIVKAMAKMDRTSAFFVGANCLEDRVEMTYHVPLSCHSGRIVLIYEKENQSLYLNAFMLGEARNRWNRCVLVSQILSCINILPLKEIPFESNQEVSFLWDVTDSKHLESALSYYELLKNDVSYSDPIFWKKLTRYLNEIAEASNCMMEMENALIQSDFPNVNCIVPLIKEMRLSDRFIVAANQKISMDERGKFIASILRGYELLLEDKQYGVDSQAFDLLIKMIKKLLEGIGKVSVISSYVEMIDILVIGKLTDDQFNRWIELCCSLISSECTLKISRDDAIAIKKVGILKIQELALKTNKKIKCDQIDKIQKILLSLSQSNSISGYVYQLSLKLKEILENLSKMS